MKIYSRDYDICFQGLVTKNLTQQKFPDILYTITITKGPPNAVIALLLQEKGSSKVMATVFMVMVVEAIVCLSCDTH